MSKQLHTDTTNPAEIKTCGNCQLPILTAFKETRCTSCGKLLCDNCKWLNLSERKCCPQVSLFTGRPNVR
jgi:hypothetical protein